MTHRIAIIGTGALGSELSRLLIEERVPDVLVIDPGVLEPANLQTSPFFQSIQATRKGNIAGLSKAEVIAHTARLSGLPWRAIHDEIADVGLLELAGRDLLVSCPDTALARVETSFYRHILRLPMLDGGVMGDGIPCGRVSWFAADPQAGCYLCGLLEQRRADLLAYTVSSALGCRLPEEAPAMLASRHTLQQTAAAMLPLILKLPSDPSGLRSGSSVESTSFVRRLTLDGSTCTMHQLALPRSPTCPWHESPEATWKALDWDRPIAESLTLSDLRVELPWPCCVSAVCRRCGHHSQPYRRVAWVRRAAPCPVCGVAGACEPVALVESVGAHDPEARLSPRQIGFPDNHLYLFRRTFVPVSRKEQDEPVA